MGRFSRQDSRVGLPIHDAKKADPNSSPASTMATQTIAGERSEGPVERLDHEWHERALQIVIVAAEAKCSCVRPRPALAA